MIPHSRLAWLFARFCQESVPADADSGAGAQACGLLPCKVRAALLHFFDSSKQAIFKICRYSSLHRCQGRIGVQALITRGACLFLLVLESFEVLGFLDPAERS